MIPALTIAASGPLADLERRILDSSAADRALVPRAVAGTRRAVLRSVDLRNRGFKLAPVDTNLFPGGFNNLNPRVPPALRAGGDDGDREHLSGRAQLPARSPRTTRATSSTCRTSRALRTILRQAGLQRAASAASCRRSARRPRSRLPDGADAARSSRSCGRGNRVGLADFDPCAILLNNDLSAGMPAILEGLPSSAVLPPLHAGWAVRRKSNHFDAYERVAKEFAQLLGDRPLAHQPVSSRSAARWTSQRQEGEECLAAQRRGRC